MSRTVAITGMGAVTAAGIGAAALWDAARTGRSGVRPVAGPGYEQSRVRIAAMVEGFDPLAYVTPELLRTLDPFSTMAIAAADEALTQAGLR
ncbi:MAG TPA: beta-ACP synthase, partial [Alphaproteobacteria bacterium]|nr:beta-ACP synthase [Alphaproteobacteria bacterium]